MTFTTFGVIAVVVGLGSLVFALSYMRQAHLNGHTWIARFVIVAIALDVILSILFVSIPMDGQITAWIRMFSRLNRIYSPLVFTAVIVYFGAAHEPQGDHRNGRHRSWPARWAHRFTSRPT